MSTGAEIQARIPLPSSLKGDDDQTLIAVQAAISAAWPTFRLTEYAAGVATLQSGVYEYSLSAVTPKIPADYPPGRVFVAVSTTEAEEQRLVRSRYDQSAGAWTLIFPPDLCVMYQGKSVNIQYQYPQPTVTDLDTNIELPDEWMINYCGWWMAMNNFAEQGTDNKIFQTIVGEFDRQMDFLRRNKATKQIGNMSLRSRGQRQRTS